MNETSINESLTGIPGAELNRLYFTLHPNGPSFTAILTTIFHKNLEGTFYLDSVELDVRNTNQLSLGIKDLLRILMLIEQADEELRAWNSTTAGREFAYLDETEFNHEYVGFLERAYKNEIGVPRPV